MLAAHYQMKVHGYHALLLSLEGHVEHVEPVGSRQRSFVRNKNHLATPHLSLAVFPCIYFHFSSQKFRRKRD